MLQLASAPALLRVLLVCMLPLTCFDVKMPDAVSLLRSRETDPTVLVMQLVDVVNDARRDHELSPVCTNSKLMAASMSMASDMAATDFFRATGVDPSSPAERVSAEGFMFTTLLEDVAAGYQDPRSAVNALLQDAAHRENILGNYAFVGAGYAYRRFGGYQHYWALYFANAIDEECDDHSSNEI